MKKRTVFLIGLLAVATLSVATFGYEVYFSDPSGNKVGQVWEGSSVYIAVKDPDKGACGIAEFPGDLVIFDFKTGAYILVEDDPNTVAYEGAWFREARAGSAVYFWVTTQGSTQKVGIEIGSRFDFTVYPYGQTHVLGNVAPAPIVPITLQGILAGQWEEGAWEYVDENVLSGDPAAFAGVNTGFAAFPRQQLTARVDFEALDSGVLVLPFEIAGRVENMDTLIAIVSDGTDPRNIDQAQVKIRDTVATLTAVPARIDYGCAGVCQNIVITIDDKDENLNCNEVEYVPFFVIVNPGGWNPDDSGINNFCALMARGGFDPVVGDLNRPIRWYNIYDEPSTGVGSLAGVTSRFLQYPAEWLLPGNEVGRALFFAQETGVDTGVFDYNFGNIEDLQAALGFRTMLPGTTLAFYYIDPNDYDDMTLATIVVGNREHSQTFITDAAGVPVQTVKIGHGGLYVRVYDADANVDACCQDKVLVHICDPHNEDDSEYYVIDEISNDSGIFFTQNGILLQPVWDAVTGYQLVFDDWKVQSFNEDTIFVRYNSVDYTLAAINALGDRNANDGLFPPAIDIAASRNQPWDVSFAMAKVYDTQVFSGTVHNMYFLNGKYERVDVIPMSGSLYLEVVDPDQNENPFLRELVAGRWNLDATPADDLGRNHGPRYDGAFGLPDPATLTESAGEDSAPIWWRSLMGEVPGDELPPGPPENGEEPPPPPPPQGDSDIMTPAGLVENIGTTPYVDPYLGGPQWTIRGSDDTGITGILETVKVLMWNAQNGNWEKMDLRETAVGSGIFRSTTCVEVSSASTRGLPGMGNLGSAPGDTIMAFYQDPSNHSDVSIISIKVSEGGAADVLPPTVALSVAFDRVSYNPGDTVTITVTDEQYAGANEVAGAGKVLILKDQTGVELASWTQIPVISGQPGKFRVSYVLPLTVTGTITAVYTDPVTPTRTAQAQATVAAPVMTGVEGVAPVPEVFSTSTVFTVVTKPAGAVPNKVTVTVYDLTGRQVAALVGTNTTSVTWTNTTLRNGAYIYVWTVEGGNPVQSWTDKGFVYIKR